MIGIGLLGRVGLWYRDHLALRPTGGTVAALSPVGRNRVIAAVAILLALTFSKNFYAAAFASYFTFFMIQRFAVSVGSARSTCFCSWARWQWAR